MIKPGDLCLVISGPATGCSCIAEGCIPPGQSEEIICKGINYKFTLGNSYYTENLWLCSNDQFISPILDKQIRGIGILRESQLLKISGDDERIKNREVVLDFGEIG